MLSKYSVEYSLHFRKHSPPDHHMFYTDDPVTWEAFIQELLERGMGIHVLRHEGAELPQADFDRVIKVAASAVASKLICTSLNIKVDEERFRFGFAA
jgi:hypothetical protein